MIDFDDLRRPESNELIGIKPWKVNYYPIVLRLVKDQDGKPIDIDIRLEMSGTYTAEQMDDLLKAVIVAKSIRQKMLIEMDIPAKRIELVPQEAIDDWWDNHYDPSMIDAGGPQQSISVDAKHYFEPTIVLLMELFSVEKLRDWLSIERHLHHDFFKARECKECMEKEAVALPPYPENPIQGD